MRDPVNACILNGILAENRHNVIGISICVDVKVDGLGKIQAENTHDR